MARPHRAKLLVAFSLALVACGQAAVEKSGFAPEGDNGKVRASAVTALANGVSVSGLSGASGSNTYFSLAVPAGASNLVFRMSGGTGDADLYVRFGSTPTSTSYDCRPYLVGNNETCTIATIQAGTYYVKLNAYEAFSGVTLVGSFTAPSSTSGSSTGSSTGTSGGGTGLVNGGFESGTLTGWSSAGSASVTSSAAHAGSNGLQLGSSTPSTDSSATQTFTAPSGGGTLSFYYDVTCPDQVTYDWATATLKDNTSGTTTTILAKTCANPSGWTQVSAALVGGHSYTLSLINHDDNYSGDATFTWFDDVTVTGSGTTGSSGSTGTTGVINAVTLGQKIFSDTRLSEPAGQSCASCHSPSAAFSDPRPGPSSEGAVAGRFGPRNAPSIVYASFTPPLSAAGDETGYGGGLFWDGRARTLEEQAQAPLLNPIEMNNPDIATVVAKLASADYASDFRAVYGADVFTDAGAAFADAMSAIASYEREGIPNRFTSKYDAYLAGAAQLTDSEARGLALFNSDRSGSGGGCAQCHINTTMSDGGAPLFTDFGYDNIGIPKNLANPFYNMPAPYNPSGVDYLDNGLGGSLHKPIQFGRFKAPTLRNVALTAPYGHNGYFADLRSVIVFYSTRDVPDAGWAAPEVNLNLNTAQVGKLGFSEQDVQDLVAYLNTLTDGWWVPDGGAPLAGSASPAQMVASGR